MNESNGEVVMTDLANSQKVSSRQENILEEIGKIERMLERKEIEIEVQEEEVDNASQRLELLNSEKSELENILTKLNYDLENPTYEE